MNEEAHCPLGASLLQLLQASADAQSTNVKTLSHDLNRPRPTVATQLKLICELMHVQSPEAAVANALELGWITRCSQESPGSLDDSKVAP
jgi:hypothetical protein